MNNLALQKHLKVIESEDNNLKNRVYVRLKGNPEIEKFNHI